MNKPINTAMENGLDYLVRKMNKVMEDAGSNVKVDLKPFIKLRNKMDGAIENDILNVAKDKVKNVTEFVDGKSGEMAHFGRLGIIVNEFASGKIDGLIDKMKSDFGLLK